MTWKNGKKWVYSITYDEGCEALLEHALPVHRKFGVPGHVALDFMDQPSVSLTEVRQALGLVDHV